MGVEGLNQTLECYRLTGQFRFYHNDDPYDLAQVSMTHDKL